MYNLIIKAFLNKEYYVRFGKSIKLSKDSKELNLVYQALKDLHERYPEENNISPEELELWFYTNNEVKPKEEEIYRILFNGIKGAETGNTEIVTEAIRRLHQRSVAEELAIQAFKLAEGQNSIEDIRKLYGQLDTIPEEEKLEDKFVTSDLELLYEQTISSPGLRWRLKTLNRVLGSLRKGDFGFVFARPETGKTTFLASEVTYFSTQTDKPILWLNNEEQGNKVMTRCYQAALGMELHELISDRPRNKAEYLERTRDLIKLYDDATIHRGQVEELCEKLGPSLIIFDQIDKIKGFSDDREDLRLGKIYIWARELAKQFSPVLGICQAAGTGGGKKWLTMEDVANAKTSKQAEADFILGIGMSDNEDDQYTRYINVSKNKLIGDPDTDPKLRHARVPVRIIPEIGRYEDLI